MKYFTEQYSWSNKKNKIGKSLFFFVDLSFILTIIIYYSLLNVLIEISRNDF